MNPKSRPLRPHLAAARLNVLACLLILATAGRSWAAPGYLDTTIGDIGRLATMQMHSMEAATILMLLTLVIVSARTRRHICPLLAAVTLAACSGGSGSGAPTSPPPASSPPATSPPADGVSSGYFSGYVGGIYAEALVTEDGEVRMWMDYAVLCSSSPGEFRSMQFIGSMERHVDGSAVAIGVLVGEGNGPVWNGEPPFCGSGLSAEVLLEQIYGGRMDGRLRLPAWAGVRDVDVYMTWPTRTYVTHAATAENAAGIYLEELAGFATAGDTVVTVDGSGAIFFQSADSGCVGNGTLVARGDGKYNVYDVDLQISECKEQFAHYNRSFAGLGTRSIGDWDWGDWLVLMLDSSERDMPQIALTMWSSRR